MKKPTHQWTCRFGAASRLDTLPEFAAALDFSGDSRAEAFELAQHPGPITFGLRAQQVHRTLASDASVQSAATAWLLARGQRRMRMVDEHGNLVAEREIAATDLDLLPTGQVMRIVTLAPSNLEMVASLQADIEIVGIEDSSDWPEEICAKAKRLGPDLNPDLEAIAALSPDLVVASLSVPGMERVVTGLRALGLPTLVLASRSISEVQSDLLRLGELLAATQRASKVVQEMNQRIAAVQQQRLPGPALPVYLEWWPKPLFVPGADCYSNELIALAGGVNVFGQRNGSSLEVSEDELAAAMPEIGFVSWCGVAFDKLDCARLLQRPALAATPMVRNRRVFALDERFSGRPGPRMVTAIEEMARVIRDCR